MRILLAHHWWEGGRNATWNPARFPVPDIEGAIKAAYDRLQMERPEHERFGGHAVFMCYHPATDYAGRDCVGISFAFVPDAGGRLKDAGLLERCRGIILPRLEAAPRTVTELEVPLPLPDASARKPGSPARWAAAAVAAALLIAGGVTLSSKGKGGNPAPDGADAPPPSVAAAPAPPAAEMPAETKAPTTPAPTPPAAPKLEAEDPVKAMCERLPDLKDGLRPCARRFAGRRCGGGVSISFPEWLKQDEDCSRNREYEKEHFFVDEKSVKSPDRTLARKFFQKR